MVGGTYKITPELTAYAGYSEANRAPTPLELACADPARPCIVAAFLIADPPLKQVVSRTVEAGFRGTKELNIGTLGWKVGAFRATNADDILAIPSPELQGFGYFQNVGRTRRQGIEAQVNLTSKTLQLYASYTLVDARFLDPLTARLPTARSPTMTAMSRSCRATEFRRFPATGSSLASITPSPTPSRSAAMPCSSASQYFAGDESNQATRLPGYSVFNRSRLVSDQQDLSSSTAASIISSTIAIRPSERSSREMTYRISPMAARNSPTLVRSPRRGRAPSMRG